MLEMTEREQEIFNKTMNVLKEYVDPRTIYLFGSRSKGTHRRGSDFDFAVTGSKPDFKIQESITKSLEKLMGLYKIDIIYLDDVEEDFRNLILNQGKIVYEK